MATSIEYRLAFTVEAARDITGLARTRLYQAIAEGSLKTFKAGRRRMVTAKALETFINNLERESQGSEAA